MSDPRKRLLYFCCAVVVMVLGLASRRYGAYLPVLVSDYAGDTLWALMVFLGISFVAPHTGADRRGGMAIAVAYVVEISQLYHAPWIDALRRTTVGGLVLGFGCLWTDFVCYAVGVSIGVVVDKLVFRRWPRGASSPRIKGSAAWSSREK